MVCCEQVRKHDAHAEPNEGAHPLDVARLAFEYQAVAGNRHGSEVMRL